MNDEHSGVIVRTKDDVTEHRGMRLMDWRHHPTKAIGYRIQAHGLRTGALGLEGWEHYLYTFHYRYDGRALQVTWRCGLAYGEPKGHDGLASAFLDADSVDGYDLEGWADEFGYDLDEHADRRRVTGMYNACVRMGERLERFLPVEHEREQWRRLLHEK